MHTHTQTHTQTHTHSDTHMHTHTHKKNSVSEDLPLIIVFLQLLC